MEKEGGKDFLHLRHNSQLWFFDKQPIDSPTKQSGVCIHYHHVFFDAIQNPLYRIIDVHIIRIRTTLIESSKEHGTTFQEKYHK